MNTLPPRLQEIVEEFALCSGQEKLEHLLDFAENLPPLPDWLKSRREELEQVHECMTPVFVYAHMENGRLSYYFDVPENSPTVRGFAAFLAKGTEDVTPEALLGIPGDFYLATGLAQVLTMQRMNGLNAILAQMKRLAVDRLSKDPVI
ncbi:MAG: SufE family protein [Chloroflexota bacterium]|nr:MAG: SufE family protein [Chloroflexota bacterium]